MIMKQKTLIDIIDEERTLFKEKEVFELDYVPKTYKFRDLQFKKMAIYSKGLKNGEIPSNMLLKGNKSTGKTTTIKKFFEILKERYDNVLTVHVNCQIYRTEYKVFSKLFEEIFSYKTNVSGLSTFDIYNKVMEQLIKENKILIVALDDFDAIKTPKELNRTLYTLLRAYETFNGAKVSVFLVTSQEPVIFLDSCVATVFHPIDIEFTPYTSEQIFDILEGRVKLGFNVNTISADLIKHATEYAYDEDDLRKGIKLLSKAGKQAENDGSKKILKKHFN